MQKHDFQQTLKALNLADLPVSSCEAEAEHRDRLLIDWVDLHGETIREALRIAKRLMQEPSDAACDAARKVGCHASIDMRNKYIFKSMRDAMLAEIAEDSSK